MPLIVTIHQLRTVFAIDCQEFSKFSEEKDRFLRGMCHTIEHSDDAEYLIGAVVLSACNAHLGKRRVKRKLCHHATQIC